MASLAAGNMNRFVKRPADSWHCQAQAPKQPPACKRLQREAVPQRWSTSKRWRLSARVVEAPFATTATACREDAAADGASVDVAVEAVAKHLAQRREGVLRRLCAHLRQLGRDRRHAVLQQCFSQAQRLALERWMLSQRSKACGNLSNKPVPALPLPRVLEQLRPEGRASDRRLPCSRARPAGVQAARRAKGQRDRGLVSLISKKTGSCSFYALAHVGMARLSSRKTCDRGVALRHHEALTALRRHITAHAGPFECRFREALAAVLPQRGLTPAGLGLRLAVRLCVHRWIGPPLSTPAFAVSKEVCLERGLRACRRLHEAREALLEAEGGASCPRRGPPTPQESQAWMALREVFLDIQEEAGLDRPTRMARLTRAERARVGHREMLTERWNRRQMSLEEAAQRRRDGTGASRLGTPVTTSQAVSVASGLLASLAHLEKRLQKALALVNACGQDKQQACVQCLRVVKCSSQAATGDQALRPRVHTADARAFLCCMG